MSRLIRWRSITAGLITSCTLLACGGGGGGSGDRISPPITALPPEVGAPVATGDVRTDGINWINYRRSQLGVPVLARNALIDNAAQGHSEYQRVNNQVTHDQVLGRQGFTGVTVRERLNSATYTIPATGYAIGEIISAAASNDGFYLSEELVTAIYHRFVMFEPRFKEIGAGSVTNATGYNYFTANLAARGGYGPGIGRGNVVSWPFNNQSAVQRNFFSDFEAPDPVPNRNEVGYPISLHADIDATLTVTSFSVRPRGGADLEVRLLRRSASDSITPESAAAIIPILPLLASTIYDVSFTGTIDGAALSKSWSFTTR